MSREKQIDEMAKDVWKASCAGRDIPCHTCKFADMKKDSYSCLDYTIAEGLYNTGYHKQSEGEWVQGNDLPKDIKFIPLSSGLYCSNCLSEAYWDSDYGQQKFDYCPNCGAKMKGADNE